MCKRVVKRIHQGIESHIYIYTKSTDHVNSRSVRIYNIRASKSPILYPKIEEQRERETRKLTSAHFPDGATKAVTRKLRLVTILPYTPRNIHIHHAMPEIHARVHPHPAENISLHFDATTCYNPNFSLSLSLSTTPTIWISNWHTG